MWAALTQRPDLFRAVVSHSGIYDMLRVELAPNGEFNTTEFGTVKNPEQFKALHAYSPYHHVKDGTAYPAVMFLTGDNDGRVDPANSRKMTARLQAATSSKFPILLRTSSTVGHGIGSGLSEIIAERADVYAFLFDQLGVKYDAAASAEKPSVSRIWTSASLRWAASQRNGAAMSVPPRPPVPAVLHAPRNSLEREDRSLV